MKLVTTGVVLYVSLFSITPSVLFAANSDLIFDVQSSVFYDTDAESIREVDVSLPTPTNVHVGISTTSDVPEISLTWSPVKSNDAFFYEIYARSVTGAEFSPVDLRWGNTYTEDIVDVGVYEYYVVAVDMQTGKVSLPSEVTSITIGEQASGF